MNMWDFASAHPVAAWCISWMVLNTIDYIAKQARKAYVRTHVEDTNTEEQEQEEENA